MKVAPIGLNFLKDLDTEIARLRELLVNHALAADDAVMVEFVRCSRRVLEVANSLKLEQVCGTARTIINLAQDCFPARINYGQGAALQLRDLLVELQVHLFEVRTGDRLPG